MRFIAVNSGVDSANQQDNEFVPFVNIINEYYVRDGSKKVRTSLRLKGESGEHLTTIPPYEKQNSVTSATLFSLNLINLSYALLP